MVYRKKSWWEKINWTLIVCSMTLWSSMFQTYTTVSKEKQEAPQAPLIQKYEAPSLELTVTAYVPSGDKVATLKKEVVGKHAAVSRDRLDLLGKCVYIMCDKVPVGRREITDLLSKGAENTVDIMVPDSDTAKKFGRQTCEVILLPPDK